MKLTIAREPLLAIAKIVAPARLPTPKLQPNADLAARNRHAERNQKAIQWCRLKALDDLVLTATDATVWLSVTVPAEVTRAGMTVIDPDKLTDILGEYTDKDAPTVTFASVESGVQLACGDKYTLATRDPNDFPAAPECGGAVSAEVAAGELASALRLAAAAADDVENEPAKPKFATE